MQALSIANAPAQAGVQQASHRRSRLPPLAAARGAADARAADEAGPQLDRRSLLAGAAALALAGACPPAEAIQGTIAGRIPGVTGPDADGYYTYQRPEGKSGGHGVGWTEVDRYSFKVPTTWEEVPVSIADLGGTEIDLRYASEDQGNLLVVVAPVLRFKDVPLNSSLNVEELGAPEQLMAGFAPELYGKPLQEGEIIDVQVRNKGDMPYYWIELSQHRLVSMAATGNRLYIMSIRAKSLQWRKHSDTLLKIRDSFTVPPKVIV